MTGYSDAVYMTTGINNNQAEHLPVEPPAQVHPFHLDTFFGTAPGRLFRAFPQG